MASDAEVFSMYVASIKQIQCKHKVTDAKYKKIAQK